MRLSRMTKTEKMNPTMKRLEVETMIDISHSVWTPRRQGRPLLMVQFATFLNWKQEGRPPTQRRGLMAQQTPPQGGSNGHVSGWLVSFRNRSFIVHLSSSFVAAMVYLFYINKI
mmetsp:Transcript_2776/g.6040  ORF Transcript_2776/g.6040 Transcript_2776/m.6040 type:complete len:114 (-) Transcript_2776:527-868(-)